VARGAKLAVLALGAHALEKVFKGVAEFLAVRVLEAVHVGEEHCEDAAVAEFQECIAKNVPEQTGQVRGFRWVTEGLDAFGKEGDTFVGGDCLREEIAPAVFR